MLDQLTGIVALLLTGITLGGMAFFAFVFAPLVFALLVFAPLVFARLPAEVAGGFIRQVFACVLSSAAVLSARAALCAWGRFEMIALAVVAALFVFALRWLLPRIDRAREAARSGTAAAARLGQLHRASVLINAAQMIAVLVVFVRLAAR